MPEFNELRAGITAALQNMVEHGGSAEDVAETLHGVKEEIDDLIQRLQPVGEEEDEGEETGEDEEEAEDEESDVDEETEGEGSSEEESSDEDKKRY